MKNNVEMVSFLITIVVLVSKTTSFLISPLPTPTSTRPAISTSSTQHKTQGAFDVSSSLWSSSSEIEASTSGVSRSSDVTPSSEWELDCYSRPVIVDGNKKLWEVLITDSTGSMRICETLPSNRVNSRQLRRVVEETIENAEVKPTHIRFFRGSMFNMMNIALQELGDDITIIPSRCTYALLKWIEERNLSVYPAMEGYKASMMATGGGGGPIGGDFLDIRTPVKLPDSLRGEKYAFVSLPLAEFLPGTGSISKENIGVGRLFPVDSNENLPGDAFIQGIVVFSSRAKALAAWLNGVELYGLKVEIRTRILIVEADITTQYLMAKLDDEQREEGAAFEQGKKELNGLHFLCVQEGEDDDMPAGFWLLRENTAGMS